MTDDLPPDRLRRRFHFVDRNLLIICSITLVAMTGVSMITPALPAVARAYGITPGQAGWLIAVFTLPGVLLSPLVGLLADRYGRKHVIVPSLLLFSVAGGACAFTTDYNHLLWLRLLQGFGGAALNTLNLTLIGDLYRGDTRVTMMGYAGGFISATAAGYPLIGGALAAIDWRIVLALPALGLPVVLLVAFGLKVPAPTGTQRLGPYFRAMAGNLVSARFLALYLSGFAIFAALYGTLVTYLPFLLEQRFGLSPAEFGLIMGLNAAAGATASFLLGTVSRHISRNTIAAGAFVLIAGPLAAIPFAPSVAVLIALVVVSGAAFGIILSLMQVMLSERAPTDQRGAVMAVNGSMFRLGQTAGPLAMGLILVSGGMNAAFLGAALLAALPLLSIGKVWSERPA